MRNKNLTLCALFAALIAVGTHIRIPAPLLPLTLQTLFVILAGLVLGRKLGAISVCVYVAAALITQRLAAFFPNSFSWKR